MKPIGPCRQCGCKKISNFYWSNKSLCKDCVISYQHKHREKNLEFYQEYDRKRNNLPHRIALRKKTWKRWKDDPKLRKRKNEQTKIWIENNTIKRAAHIIAGNAIRNGRL